MESERHLESVLSKLMGLDRLPPQSSLHGQQRVLSEKYLWNIASLENAVSMAHRERWLFDDNSIIDVDEQLEIKDAFENHLGSRIDGHHKLTVERENSVLSTKEAWKADAKIKKNGKGLLEGQNVLHFENPAYCFKGLNCNENLYYLSTQHPYTLPTVMPCPRLGHLTVRRSTAAFASATEAEVEVSGTLGRVKSFQKSETRSFAKSHVEPDSSYLKKQVKSQLEIKERCLSYARFDPTLDNGSVNHTGRTSFSACCLSIDMQHKYSSSVRSKGIYFEARGSKNFQDICMVPRGIAKQITSQIKDSMWHRYSKISASESRSRFSSTNECEESIPSSSYRFVSKNQREASLFIPNGKSSNKEAKKQPSKRWTMTKRLVEMLRVANQESKCQNSDSTLVANAGLSGLDDKDVELSCPLGPGNLDGWKIGSAREFYRSTLGSLSWNPKCGKKQFTVHKDWCLKPGQNDNVECRKLREDNLDPEGDFETIVPRSVLCTDSEENHSDQQTHLIVNNLNKHEEENLSEENSTVHSSGCNSACSDMEVVSNLETQNIPDELQYRLQDSHFSLKESAPSKSLACSFSSINIDAAEIGVGEHEDTGMSFERQFEQVSEASTRILFRKNGESTFDDLDASMQQFRDDALMPSHSGETKTETKTEYPFGSMEVYEPSGYSTLEAKEIYPEAEFFERRGNSIHEFLESESGEPGMVDSSDEDTEGSTGCYGGNKEIMGIYSVQESRDFSYLVDVLAESDFHGVNSKMDCKHWQSLQYALDPSVFDAMEKKYGKQTSWERSERRLLFDSINLGLMEILEPHANINMSSRSLAKRFMLSQNQEAIEDKLWTMLICEQMKAKRNSCDNVLSRETEWLKLDEEMGSAVREMERLLVDELVEEIISMESF